MIHETKKILKKHLTSQTTYITIELEQKTKKKEDEKNETTKKQNKYYHSTI